MMNDIYVLTGFLFALTSSNAGPADPVYRQFQKTGTAQLYNMANSTHKNQLAKGDYSTGTTLDSSGELSSGNRSLRGSDQALIYPDMMRGKPNCVYGFCSEVTDYPKEKIANLLKNSKLDEDIYTEPENGIDIINRNGATEVELCETKQHTIYPETAKNLKNIEQTIVNVDGHKQGIVFEMCLENNQCKFHDRFPDQYTSICQQKFSTRRLMVLSSGEKFAFDTFRIPSCCVCALKEE